MKTFKCITADQTISELETAFGFKLPIPVDNLESIPIEKRPYQCILNIPTTSTTGNDNTSATLNFLLPESKPDWSPAVSSDVLPFDPVLDAPPCRVDNVTHGYFTNTRGHRIHYVEAGEGPVVLLCHG